MSFVDFINAGKSIGLEGKQLRDWAEEELHKFKEEERLKREHEKEEERLKREHENKKQERDLEMLKQKK